MLTVWSIIKHLNRKLVGHLECIGTLSSLDVNDNNEDGLLVL